MRRSALVVPIALVLLLSGGAVAQQQERLVEQALDTKLGPLSRLSPELISIYRQAEAARAAAAVPPPGTEPPEGAGTAQLRPANLAPVTDDGRVLIDAVADGETGSLLTELEPLGFETTGIWGRVVSGYLPIAALEELAAATNLRFARAAVARNNVGVVTSQGVEALGADVVLAEFGADGSGVTVGVLSDSFDCLGGAAGDVASGDLPAGITVLDDTACPGSDEGRAMMQLVADVAPGAAQAFHTASIGQAGFAQGIVDLATVAGADIIVDDILFLAEPMFQDGIVAQAVDAVRAGGTAYFSAAGNSDREAWEDGFRPSGVAGFFGGMRHDFDPGPGVDDLQSFILEPGLTIFVLQWDEPFFSVSGAPGSSSDLDILLYLGGIFTGIGGISPNIGGDAVEIFGVINTSGAALGVELGIELFDGPEPELMKYVFFPETTGEVAEHATDSGSLYGHMNAAGAEAVGASAYFNTPAFNPGLTEPVINGFSSAGGTPILFDTAGNPTFDLRLKPQIVGPDGGNTTFFGFDIEPDGFPNFFGTSAAAPHAAAVAALMLDANGTLDPAAINAILESTAIDMDDPSTPGFDTGFDFGTGFGFVDAQAAVFGAALDGDKVFVCHKGAGAGTLSIGVPALEAHLGHGDSIGLCD